jgi:undecaprenyl-diphosphatase
VLTPFFLGWEIPEEQAFLFDVLVQSATLVAVILYFRADLLAIVRSFVGGLVARQPFSEPAARLGWLLLLATVPAGIAGLVLKDAVTQSFSNPALTAVLLFGTAILLVIAEVIGRRSRPLDDIGWKDSLWIGLFQAIAIFPGISRSGATITGGMTRNLERPASARFAFLMSIPIMTAASLLAAADLAQSNLLATSLLPLLAGCLTAGLVGYLSIRWMLRFLAHRSLYPFAIYCFVTGILTLVLIYG